jgi:hypothetical protein
MKPANTNKSSARKIWLAALLGFGAGVLGGAAYLLLDGEYLFNIPLWSRVVLSRIFCRRTSLLQLAPSGGGIQGRGRSGCRPGLRFDRRAGTLDLDHGQAAAEQFG